MGIFVVAKEMMVHVIGGIVRLWISYLLRL